MKTFKFFVIIASLVLVTTSCVENSEKYKVVVSQRDSLAMEKQVLDSSYNQSLVLLNDIETGFANISQNEREMKVNLKGVEGSKTSKRDLIAAQMTAIKMTMEQNRARIEELQRLSDKSGKTNNMLTATIKRLQTEMEEKGLQIQTLQAELEQKNIKINELNATVNVQSKSIADQQNELEQQKSALKQQDAGLNTVWYRIATSKILKAEKIVTSGGLFQSKKVLDNEFDNNTFIQADLRNILSIPTNSKRITILSSHPKNSYNLIPDTDKNIYIEIINPSKFWSVSKYLVVQI
jgi:chromosome segregation ATPase